MPKKKVVKSENKSNNKKKKKNEKVFELNEVILAYHGPLLYKAKVIDIKDNMYLVHYNGWNKNWDEWLDASRIEKETKESLEKAKKLKEEVKLNAERKKTINKIKSNKRKHPDTIDESNEANAKDIKINIPGDLKKFLVSDWNMTVCEQRILKLPKKPTVKEVLADYLQQKLKKSSENSGVLEEVVKGITSYFRRSLACSLLYRIERPQYNDVVKEKDDVGDIYGAEHLLRLFIKLPSLLSHTTLEERQVVTLNKHLGDFLKWLNKNSSTYISLDQYEKVDESYKKRIKAIKND